MKTHQILLTITTSKGIPDLADFVAGRAYTIDGVTDVAASAPPAILDVGEARQRLIEAGWRPPSDFELPAELPAPKFYCVAKVVSSKTMWGSKKKAVIYMDEIPENTYLYAKA